ncbi:MAG: cupin domain-containing protein [Planctomycetes bacterium]|nr:cupin domain-containing protein [Planctomycetota bacterium]
MTASADAAVHRWEDLAADQPMERLSRRRLVGVHAMLSEIRLRAGCHVPTHAHANEQFACVISGRMRFGLGAEGSPERREVTLGAGEVLHLPPHVEHSADALEDSVVLDVFSPPSEKTGIDAHG